MRLDERLREGLRRDAASFRPDVEDHLRRVRGRSPTRRSQLRASLAAAAVLVVMVVGLRLAHIDPLALVGPLFEGGRQTPSPSVARDAVAGTYHARVGGEVPPVGSVSFAGDWTLTLGRDSSVVLTPPAAFAETTEPYSGDVYALTGDRLVITLFAQDFAQDCAGVGTYRWSREGERLLLEVVDDMCPQRVAVLSSAAWLLVPG